MNDQNTNDMRLAEEFRGIGTIESRDLHCSGVHYEISRFQGYTTSGMPVPGVHRIEGRVSSPEGLDTRDLIDRELTLRLEDGRSLRIALADESGRVLSVGHGPSRCTCC